MCKMDTDQRLQNLTPQLAACTSHLWGFLFLEIYMDKMREEFEAWAINCDLCTFAVGDEYKYMTTEWAWRAWKASRAALCVELPSFENGSIRGYSGDCEEARMVIDCVAESLEAAGVSYK